MSLVLVVDDDPSIIRLISECLKPLGSAMAAASSVAEASLVIESENVDLLLTDVYLADGTGFDLMWKVRKSGRADAPVLLISGTPDRAMRAKAIEAGAADFLDKPLDRALVLVRVKSLLELSRLRQQQRQLSEFLVHDMKQPLAVIRATADWLHEQPQIPEAMSAITDLSISAGRLQRMVEDLLSVAKAEQVGLQVDLQPLALGSFCQMIADRYLRLSEARQIAFSVRVDDNISAIADSVMLERVIGNLIENGLRYASTRIHMTVEARGKEAVIAVANDGPSIPLAQRAGLFEKFAQSGAGGSMGLGLYFCRLVLALQNGRIRLADDTGFAVIFEVILPATVR